MSDQVGYIGVETPGDGDGEFNAVSFLVRQMIGRINTATPVQVISVTNTGGLSLVGFVDVQPMVNRIDGASNAVPNGPIYRLPYFRIQGGKNAVILDPEIGDLGVAVFADRDTTNFNSTRKQSNPGSGARHSVSDGYYHGGFLNAPPSQYVQFITGVGINIVSPTKVTITAPETDIIGLLKNNGVNVGSTHEHGGVQTGGSNTGAPV